MVFDLLVPEAFVADLRKAYTIARPNSFQPRNLPIYAVNKKKNFLLHFLNRGGGKGLWILVLLSAHTKRFIVSFTQDLKRQRMPGCMAVKLYGVAPLITYPSLTSFINLSEEKREKSDMSHMTLNT